MGEDLREFFRFWHRYFLANSADDDAVPWGAADPLTAGEFGRVSASVAAFQLGEYSEGRGLLKLAAAQAALMGEPLLTEVTRLFIREEQRHALMLGRFMDSHAMPRLKRHWADTVFRRLRGLLDFELSVTVLITAEIISLTYYDALRRSTDSKILRALCEKIIRDEAAHVRYESELLLRLRAARPPLGRLAARALHSFLFSGTIVVVYFGHRPVLDGGGYDFRRFRASCRDNFRDLFTRGREPLRRAIMPRPND
jgi:hypothetical protein